MRETGGKAGREGPYRTLNSNSYLNIPFLRNEEENSEDGESHKKGPVFK